MTMRLGVVIQRKETYRLVGSVIEEALRQGMDVVCWHNYGHPQKGLKAYQFPSEESVPRFIHGRPVVRSYRSPSELKALLLEDSVGCVIALEPPVAHFPECRPWEGPPWILLQYLGDTVYNCGPIDLLTADAIAVHSEWWVKWMVRRLAAEGRIDDPERFEGELREKSVIVGVPELDQISLLNPDPARVRWGIPAGKPVVVLLPFPGAVNPFSFWANRIYLESNPLKQMASIVLKKRWDYWQWVRDGWNDEAVVENIRRFCDQNGALLVVKSRLKTPIPRYTARLADICLYDESPRYPATILDVLSIASFSIGFYSGAVLESIALGVPHLTISFSGRDYYDLDPSHLVCFDTYYGHEEGSIFQFQHATTAMTIPEVIRKLPHLQLADFSMKEEARAAYLSKFCGPVDGTASARVLEIAKQIRRGVERKVSHGF